MASLSLRIYQKLDESTEFSVLLENKRLKTSLLFQAGTVAELGQAETDAIRSDHFSRLADSYGCLGVLQRCPSENTEYYLIVVTRCVKVCVLLNSSIYKIQEVDVISLQQPRLPGYKSQDEDNWVKEIKKLMGNESFYFSVSVAGDSRPLDLTLCAQRRARTDISDNRFFWNRMLYLHPKRFDINCDAWLLKVICGSVEFSSVYMGNHAPKLYVISRLSCERAGTRFMMRGVDDYGHVANFVETEELVHVETLDNVILSYVQTRGTVPLFWEQPGLNVGSHKVKMSREPTISGKAFSEHMRFLRHKYGGLAVINVLGTGVTGKSQGEAALSHLFQLQHKTCPWSCDCPHIVFDFHQECRGGNTDNLSRKLQPQIQQQIDSFCLFCLRGGVVVQEQRGVMRTNCLDCLDRTNRIQTFLGLERLDAMLDLLGEAATSGVIKHRLRSKFEDMWKDNGNKISQIYAGTGALQGSKIIDGARSVGRTIQNNLMDSSKQEAIDLLLHGNLLDNYLAALARTVLPQHLQYAPLSVLKSVTDRIPEFSEPLPLKVCVGTYNVNGGKHFRSLAYKHLSLDDWLLDYSNNNGANFLVQTSAEEEKSNKKPPDLFAIGFEEIVDLNASNIMSNTQWSENANSWGHELEKVISRDENFVMVTWAQLVGVALFVFVNEKHAAHVKYVNVHTVKTGMQGNTGNKGAVGIRLLVHNTSIAFVCSHFAAGQKEVNERNQDYDSIARKMIFNLKVPLWAHDYVFWCGDFNYRINLPREEIVRLVKQSEWDLLLEHDQLLLSQKENKCFPGFKEGAIKFAPTYKYDLFSDDYDTSEKARSPAWTDRVLFWRRRYKWQENCPWSHGNIDHYSCAALKQSDHRPVLAAISCEGRKVDEAKLDAVYKEVVSSLGPSDCTVLVQCVSGKQMGEELSEKVLEAVQEAMDALGTLVTVRFQNYNILFTYDSPKQALDAISSSPIKVDGLEFSIKLKTERWQELLEEEMRFCMDTTTPLCTETIPTPPDLPSSTSLLAPSSVRDVLGQLYSQSAQSPMPSPCPSPSFDPGRESSSGSEPPSDDEQTSPRFVPVRPAPVRPAMPSRPPPPRPQYSSPTHGPKETSSASPVISRAASKPVGNSPPLPSPPRSSYSVETVSSAEGSPLDGSSVSSNSGIASSASLSRRDVPLPHYPNTAQQDPSVAATPPSFPSAYELPSIPPPQQAPTLPVENLNSQSPFPPTAEAPPSPHPPAEAPPFLPPPAEAPPSLPPPAEAPPSLPPSVPVRTETSPPLGACILRPNGPVSAGGPPPLPVRGGAGRSGPPSLPARSAVPSLPPRTLPTVPGRALPTVPPRK
ncbi:synaptojanin-1 isoform X2 [Hyalella azteca]|uniref:phosphoinositide 5-phosphatase n=1 Tax=Hyalella azteca TaxID=294128 RepID=A0A8B7P4U8_HYAAZ|nr:synaptojanin-1 isoform X2 [Hyalella azteca]